MSETISETCLRLAEDRGFDITPAVRCALRMAADEIERLAATDEAGGWEAKLIDCFWCVGLRGNLDTIHDARITVHRHVEIGDDTQQIAEWIAAHLPQPPQPQEQVR